MLEDTSAVLSKTKEIKKLSPLVHYNSNDKHYYISLLYRIPNVGTHIILCHKLLQLSKVNKEPSFRYSKSTYNNQYNIFLEKNYYSDTNYASPGKIDNTTLLNHKDSICSLESNRTRLQNTLVDDIPQLIEIMLREIDDLPISYPLYNLLLLKSKESFSFRICLFLRLKSVLGTVNEKMAAHCYYLCCDLLKIESYQIRMNLDGLLSRYIFSKQFSLCKNRITKRNSLSMKENETKSPCDKNNDRVVFDNNIRTNIDLDRLNSNVGSIDFPGAEIPITDQCSTYFVTQSDSSKTPVELQKNKRFKFKLFKFSRSFSIIKKTKIPNIQGLMLFFVRAVTSIFKESSFSKELTKMSNIFNIRKIHRNLSSKDLKKSISQNIYVLESLVEISNNLRSINAMSEIKRSSNDKSTGLRQRALKIYMEYLNLTICKGISHPFDSSKKIVNFLVDHAKSLDSAENVPYIVLAECVDKNEKFNCSDINSRFLKSNEKSNLIGDSYKNFTDKNLNKQEDIQVQPANVISNDKNETLKFIKNDLSYSDINHNIKALDSMSLDSYNSNLMIKGNINSQISENDVHDVNLYQNQDRGNRNVQYKKTFTKGFYRYNNPFNLDNDIFNNKIKIVKALIKQLESLNSLDALGDVDKIKDSVIFAIENIFFSNKLSINKENTTRDDLDILTSNANIDLKESKDIQVSESVKSLNLPLSNISDKTEYTGLLGSNASSGNIQNVNQNIEESVSISSTCFDKNANISAITDSTLVTREDQFVTNVTVGQEDKLMGNNSTDKDDKSLINSISHQKNISLNDALTDHIQGYNLIESQNSTKDRQDLPDCGSLHFNNKTSYDNNQINSSKCSGCIINSGKSNFLSNHINENEVLESDRVNYPGEIRTLENNLKYDARNNEENRESKNINILENDKSIEGDSKCNIFETFKCNNQTDLACQSNLNTIFSNEDLSKDESILQLIESINDTNTEINVEQFIPQIVEFQPMDNSSEKNILYKFSAPLKSRLKAKPSVNHIAEKLKESSNQEMDIPVVSHVNNSLVNDEAADKSYLDAENQIQPLKSRSDTLSNDQMAHDISQNVINDPNLDMKSNIAQPDNANLMTSSFGENPIHFLYEHEKIEDIYICDTQKAKNLLKSNHKSFSTLEKEVSVNSEYYKILASQGRESSWKLISFIVKSGGIIKHEYLAYQIITQMKEIFILEKLPIYLRNYKIFLISDSSGLVETVVDSISIHRLKVETKVKSLKEYYEATFTDFDKAKRNFLHSLVGYSLASYVLQIKDRHNGNIMIDAFGHVIHVDFGFTFGKHPGLVSVEYAPFKLSTEYLELLDIEEFKSLFIKGFKALRKHKDKLCRLVEIMKDSDYIDKFSYEAYVERLKLNENDLNIEIYCNLLIEKALKSIGTVVYDRFQYFSNGYL